MKLTLAAVSAVALSAALAIPSTSHAYVRETSNWNPASLPISYRINLASAPASLGAAAAQAAIDGGMASWAAPTCTRWRATNAGTTAVTAARAGDGENSMLWISGSWPAELGGVNSTIGVTTPVWRSGGYFIDADIQYNNVGFRWATTGAANTVDAQSIATHEEGHFLGLDHTTVRNAVMYPSYSGGLVRNLSSDDIAGVCAIYPSGGPVPDAGTVTPSDPCARYTSCAGCTPVNGCGWCGATNSCVTSGPTGPTGGACAAGFAWLPRDCSTTVTPTPDAGVVADRPAATDVGSPSDPCSRFTTCDTCAPVNPCGWCGATGRCVSGTPTGPSVGTCGAGYVWDPAACMSGTTPAGGTAAFGEPCRQPADCSSGGICVGSSATTAFCTRVCVDDCSCPRGFRCGGRLSTGQMVCVQGTNTCDVPATDAGAPRDVVTPPDVPATPDASTPPADVPSMPDDLGMTSPDAAKTGADAASEASTTGGGSSGGSAAGCGCDVPGTTRAPSSWALGLVGLALVSRRRRARR